MKLTDPDSQSYFNGMLRPIIQREVVTDRDRAKPFNAEKQDVERLFESRIHI